MKLASTLDLVELRFNACDPLLDHAPVGLDLGFSRPAEEAEAAALALKMGPRPHQPALLIGQMRQFDLQSPFPRARPSPEYFEYQSGPVDNFCVPRFFKIALLNRRDRAIHDDDRRCQALHHSGDFVDLAFADVGRRTAVAEHDEPCLHNRKINRAREAHRLFEARFGRTVVRGRADFPARRHLDPGLNDDRTAGLAARYYRAQEIAGLIAST